MNLPLEVKKIANEGLAMMICRVQALIDVHEIDVARQHFSDEKLLDQIRLGLLEYVAVELQFQIDDIDAKLEMKA